VRWRLGLVDSAWFGSRWEGRPGLEQTKAIGFETIDLFVGYDPADRSDAQREAQRRELAEIGLPVWALLCTPLGLADFNDGVRRYHIDRSKRVVELASDLEAESFMLCPGEYVFQKQLLPPEWEWGRLAEAVREIGEHAADRGLTVAVELLPFEYAFINSVDSMVRLLDEVGLECVTAAVDISHFWLQRIDSSELRRLDGRIGQVHIADCDGVHHGDLPAGTGTTPFGDYLAAIRDAGFEGTASVELEFPPDPSLMLDWVSEAYRGSLEVLEQAGVRGSAR
jgi:D-psicose/D-tagatose/L-ribulose 3-epimerase